MSADTDTTPNRAGLLGDDPRAMLPIEEVAVLLAVHVRTLKRLHEQNPDEYPAEQIGVSWRIPRWWVERKVACRPPA